MPEKGCLTSRSCGTFHSLCVRHPAPGNLALGYPSFRYLLSGHQESIAPDPASATIASVKGPQAVDLLSIITSENPLIHPA